MKTAVVILLGAFDLYMWLIHIPILLWEIFA
jgi:hypothetical protein